MENLEFERFGNSGVTVKYEGKLNLDTAAEYGGTIKDYVEDEDITELVLDFDKIDYISSIGIRILVELNQKMASPKSMTVINVGTQVIESLRMTGLDRFLKIN